jgi:hypothetical protein
VAWHWHVLALQHSRIWWGVVYTQAVANDLLQNMA